MDIIQHIHSTCQKQPCPLLSRFFIMLIVLKNQICGKAQCHIYLFVFLQGYIPVFHRVLCIYVDVDLVNFLFVYFLVLFPKGYFPLPLPLQEVMYFLDTWEFLAIHSFHLANLINTAG